MKNKEKCEHDVDCIVQPIIGDRATFRPLFKCKKCKSIFCGEEEGLEELKFIDLEGVDK